MIRRHARELEDGDRVVIAQHGYTVREVSIEAGVVRLALAGGATAFLAPFERVWTLL